MQCPECKSELIEEHHSAVAVDRCKGCNGYWFDKDEIEAFARSKETFLKRKVVDESDFLSVTSIPAGSLPALFSRDPRGRPFQRTLFLSVQPVQRFLSNR
jgi:hypothetical protein